MKILLSESAQECYSKEGSTRASLAGDNTERNFD